MTDMDELFIVGALLAYFFGLAFFCYLHSKNKPMLFKKWFILVPVIVVVCIDYSAGKAYSGYALTRFLDRYFIIEWLFSISVAMFLGGHTVMVNSVEKQDDNKDEVDAIVEGIKGANKPNSLSRLLDPLQFFKPSRGEFWFTWWFK